MVKCSSKGFIHTEFISYFLLLVADLFRKAFFSLISINCNYFDEVTAYFLMSGRNPYKRDL